MDSARHSRNQSSADFQVYQYLPESLQAATNFRSAAVCAAPAAAWPRFQRAAAGSSTTAAVHFGCGLAALRCIADFQSASAASVRARRVSQQSAIQQVGNLRYAFATWFVLQGLSHLGGELELTRASSGALVVVTTILSRTFCIPSTTITWPGWSPS